MLLRILAFTVVGSLGAWMEVTSALGQPIPRLDSASAYWFQRGTTNEVTLNGEAMSAATVVLFTGSGLGGSPVPKSVPAVTLEGSASGLSVGAESSKALTIQLVVASDGALGSRELRVAGANGVSNPLTINVSDLLEVAERRPNQQPADAPLTTLPAAISGIIGASAESDYFRFHASAGEKLIFDVQANRFGSPLDPTLVLFDPAGKEVARSEDAHGLDPFLEFTPSVDGEYTAQLHDLRFQGGGDYRYRIVAGVLPYLEFLFPFGGRRGSSVDLELKGRNLEGAEKMTVRIAPDATPGRQDLRAHSSRGYSNPQPFEAGDLPEFMETEPNNTNGQANAVSAPIVINGRLGEPQDVDVFRIKAPADQKLVVDVQARRFGSPLDALLTLMDAQGNVLQRNDDANGPDARIEFDAKKDMEYLLSLRDLTDRGGERFGYRMSLQPPNTTPDFAVRLAVGRFRVNRGGATDVRCEVDRKNGFDGSVRVTADGLPAGVTASTLILGGPQNFGWLILAARDEAAAGYFPLKLTAVGELAGKAIVRAAQSPEASWLTVLPSALCSVNVTPTSVLVEQNGGATLDVSVIRRDGFEGDVRILAEDLPGVSIPAVTIPAGQSRAKLSLNAAYNAEVGTRPVMVRAEAISEGVTNVVHAPMPVPLTTQGIAMFLTAMLPGSPFFRTDPVRLSAVALPTNAPSAANATEFVVKADRRGLTGEIALALEGLPAGVAATVNNIVADKNEATIKLLVSDQAETGKEYKFNVVGTATHNDRIWRQKTEPVTLLIAAPEKEPAAVAVPTPSVPSVGAAK